jgi:hypothetical protein
MDEKWRGEGLGMGLVLAVEVNGLMVVWVAEEEPVTLFKIQNQAHVINQRPPCVPSIV